MSNFIAISVFCCFLIADVNSLTMEWSSWTDCAESESCFQRRSLNCSAGEREACLNETDKAFAQRVLNCSASLDCLENVNEMFHAPEVGVAIFFYLFKKRAILM